MLIGINDLSRGVSPDSVVKNILLIADYLHDHTPATRLYVQSLLPVNDRFGKFGTHTNKGPEILAVNRALQMDAPGHHYSFVDLYSSFCDSGGKLQPAFTNDGLHLTGEGYLLWKHILHANIFDLAEKPSLIPLPCQLQWRPGFFWLNRCAGITFRDSVLAGEARLLQEELTRKGIHLPIYREHGAGSIDSGHRMEGGYIRLRLGDATAESGRNEAYRLAVSPNEVEIIGNAPHGVFNDSQTLLQLARDGVIIDGCTITDRPAFSWRGYMVDVARNFQSMGLLKQQIEMMGRYKLNVFHFHLTEDIAWRIAIRKYPPLTAANTMLRDAGSFYSEENIRDLMAYCSERHILFLPEIDMPGHSGAFTRAMKMDMQSVAGLAAVKAILWELIATYHFPYIHIGGDEVRITDTTFLPRVQALLDSAGVQAIGWEPGGNLGENCLRQLWKGYGPIVDTHHVCIDSRHLYLNHMDPLESVVTIFNRRIGGVDAQTARLIGATICLWNDRAVANEKDLLRMNPVYPGMLAFAERSWRGGGQSGWVTGIGEPGTKRAEAFAEFEARLMDQRSENFAGLPFPYVRQSSTVWNLYGPFSNNGSLSQAFAPEKETDYMEKHAAIQREVGGTLVLRHWWFPAVDGVLKNPRENTTWYATTRIWSDADTTMGCWIGFDNLSRSMATGAPSPGTWDQRNSRIWVNGIAIAAPFWKYGGQKGDLERPLTDEGYEYRPPLTVFFKKGWNTVLVKIPVGSFKARDGQHPVKWMFTFVPS